MPEDVDLLSPGKLQAVLAAAQTQVADVGLARIAGVSARRWAEWRSKAMVDDAAEAQGLPLGAYGRLFREVDGALAEGQLMLAQAVFQGALPSYAEDGSLISRGDPTLALKVLERRSPEWSPKSRLSVSAGEADEMSAILADAAAVPQAPSPKELEPASGPQADEERSGQVSAFDDVLALLDRPRD